MNGVRRPKGPQYLSPARQGWACKRAKNILFCFARFSQPWRAGLTYLAPLALSRVHWLNAPAPLAGAGLVTSSATRFMGSPNAPLSAHRDHEPVGPAQ